jgi:stage IV sporulation protein B
MTGGKAFEAEIGSVKKGKCGQPGQLKGCAEGNEPCGILTRNTPQGVFGISPEGWDGQPIPVAEFEEVKTGAASIRSTVREDSPREYSVEILKIYPQDRQDGRNFLIKVTDPALLDATGGIVQGMSGSPIIQDGKLVGAVTHVLVNDPTRGYGIFIENMLTAAS